MPSPDYLFWSSAGCLFAADVLVVVHHVLPSLRRGEESPDSLAAAATAIFGSIVVLLPGPVLTLAAVALFVPTAAILARADTARLRALAVLPPFATGGILITLLVAG